jgi:hypothetical protein
MDVKVLIDAIVRQTTVLIAQLSTSAGIRAPLAHVADQVFLDLSAEIEAQGVSRKVAADMFGLALRSYQKKVQRLTESAAVRSRTLWEAVLDVICERGSMPRDAIIGHFKRDPERDVAAVLNDLVGQGLLYCTGKGGSAVYGPTSEADRRRVAQGNQRESTDAMIWLSLYRSPQTLAELALALSLAEAVVAQSVATLKHEGRVTESDGVLRAETFLVPVGAEQGWEAAVFDHYHAVATAIAAKLRRGAPRSEADDVVGGATLTFELPLGHSMEAEVLGVLRKVRRELNELWQRCESERARAPEDTECTRVTFYFGQSVAERDGRGQGED